MKNEKGNDNVVNTIQENPPVPDMPQHDPPFICYVRRRGRFKAITKDEEGEKKLDKEVNEKIEVEGKKEDKDRKLHTAKKRAKETTNDNMKDSKKRKTKNEQHSPDDPFKRTMDNVKCYPFELFYLTCGIDVSKIFFAQLAKPHQLLKGEDMEVLAAMLWERMSSSDTKKHISVIDHRFPSLLVDEYFEFQSQYLQSSFVWHRFLPVFLLGNTVTENKAWGKDVDTVYCPMCWESNHWVGLVIYLNSSNIEILDPFIERTSDKEVAKHMDPITKMLPILLKDICGYTDPSNVPLSAFTWKRLTVYQASKESDCGGVALKLIEMHISGRTIEDMAAITSKDITEARKKYVVDVYNTLISREDRLNLLPL